MNKQSKTEKQGKAFGDADAALKTATPNLAASIAMAASDIAIVLDPDGEIVDYAAESVDVPEMADWAGSSWTDTVTVESRPKIEAMLADSEAGRAGSWRQVTHISETGDFPVQYRVLPLDKAGRVIALGRDMRDAALLQQRLIQAQQSLERDYLKLRQAESRYRMLFEMASEPTLIVEAESRHIREANPAAHEFLGAKAGSLPGRSLSALFKRGERETLIGYLGAALKSVSPGPVMLETAKPKAEIAMWATGFRQEGEQFFLVRMAPADGDSDHSPARLPLGALVERMPDGFVVADSDMEIVATNASFVEMVGAASAEQLRGRPLGDYLGRPGIDLDLIRNQLVQHGIARNIGTIIRAGEGAEDEEVELSAVAVNDNADHFGFSIRIVSRRLRDLPPARQDLPRSVEQLTELVGRMSLKDIVRESTDLIERLCIEAALSYTSDNRASAAEILGLSRQSLYSKLHRYGLGNLVSEPD